MDKKKQICMIAYTEYLTDARVRREAETLASFDDFSVLFLPLMAGSSPEKYAAGNVAVQEMKISKYRGKNVFKYLFSYFKFLMVAFFYCSKLLLEGKIDVVHVHNMPNFIVFAGLLAKLFGKKIILDIHDSMPETYVSKFPIKMSRCLFRALCLEEKICCGFADKVICVNHVQQDLLISRGLKSDKTLVSMNAPDDKIFVPIQREVFNEHRKPPFTIVYHGTITKRLGVDLAIEALSMLSATIPDLEFYIFGTGDDKNAFVELSMNLGVGSKVHFNQGMISVEKLPAVLSGMKLGVIANRKDIATEFMLPVKMLEYIALDIPVVAPRLKTIEHYFDEDMVTYFEPGNLHSLADAISGFYEDQARGVKQAQAARKFLEEYGWQKHQYDLINFYRAI